jgi:hypothetical protein
MFLLPQFGKGGTGNGNRSMLPIDKKDAIYGIAVPGGDGSKQVHKSNLDGRGESSRADFKRRNNIAHNVRYPGGQCTGYECRQTSQFKLFAAPHLIAPNPDTHYPLPQRMHVDSFMQPLEPL